MGVSTSFFFFLFNDTATTEIYTLSLHDALPISRPHRRLRRAAAVSPPDDRSVANQDLRARRVGRSDLDRDRKSTGLNSSHGYISYAVFCLKKKKKKTQSVVPLTASRSVTSSATT